MRLISKVCEDHRHDSCGGGLITNQRVCQCLCHQRRRRTTAAIPERQAV